MANLLIRKFQDRVGRIITVIKDTVTHKYTIEEKLFDAEGNSLLVDHNGCSVAMISYTFPNRKACMKELNNKYKRDNIQK